MVSCIACVTSEHLEHSAPLQGHVLADSCRWDGPWAPWDSLGLLGHSQCELKRENVEDVEDVEAQGCLSNDNNLDQALALARTSLCLQSEKHSTPIHIHIILSYA